VIRNAYRRRPGLEVTGDTSLASIVTYAVAILDERASPTRTRTSPADKANNTALVSLRDVISARLVGSAIQLNGG
jgi:hypothetical protein